MKRTLSTIALSLVCVVAWASDFENLVDRLTMSNPSLRAELQQITADSLSMRADNNLEDPSVSFESLFGKEENKYSLEISQSFDWPSLYKARRRLNDMAGAAAVARLSATQAQTRLEVEVLLLDIIASKKLLADYERSLQIFTSLFETYQAEYAKGNISVLEVNKLRIEVANYTQLVADERQLCADAVGRLSAMTAGIDVESAVAALDEFPVYELASLEAYRQRLVTDSPQLAAVRMRREYERQGVEVARLSTRPGFSIGYRYENEASQSFNGFSVGFSLPLWGGRGRRAAAEAAVVATDLEEQALVNELDARIRASYASAQSLQARIAEYSRALVATDNVGILTRAFEGGQVTLTDYITDLRFFIDAQVQLYRLQHDYAATVATLRSY